MHACLGGGGARGGRGVCGGGEEGRVRRVTGCWRRKERMNERMGIGSMRKCVDRRLGEREEGGGCGRQTRGLTLTDGRKRTESL